MSARSNRYLASFLLASSLALGISYPAHAQPRGEGRGHIHHMHSERWLRQLELSEAQRDQVFKIFHDQAPAIREQMKLARRAGEELRKAASAADFDRARARQLADAEAKALGEIAFMRADGMSRVVALLTPEQLSRLEQRR